MIIKTFISSVLDQNMYIIHTDKECYIIDPGDELMIDVIDYIKNNELNLKGILITHGHFDHIMGIESVINYKNVPVYISKEDKEKLYNSSLSLSFWINKDFVLNKDIKIIEVTEGDKIFTLEVLKTPGHTNGSLCFYSKEDNVIFTGDTLFYRTYGRVDFPTGNKIEMIKTIDRLKKLPKETLVYSGHGPTTYIKNEINLYIY